MWVLNVGNAKLESAVLIHMPYMKAVLEIKQKHNSKTFDKMLA